MGFVLFFCFVFAGILWVGVGSITLRQECPEGEVHRSCSFHSEYTCWKTSERVERVKDVPKRLSHCKTGCYCKQGLVRGYPRGPCIAAAGCRDRKLQAVLKKVPILDVWLY